MKKYNLAFRFRIYPNEISDIGTSSYFFETFSDNTDYDLQENGGPEIVEVHRELLIIINEALD